MKVGFSESVDDRADRKGEGNRMVDSERRQKSNQKDKDKSNQSEDGGWDRRGERIRPGSKTKQRFVNDALVRAGLSLDEVVAPGVQAYDSPRPAQALVELHSVGSEDVAKDEVGDSNNEKEMTPGEEVELLKERLHQYFLTRLVLFLN